MGGPPCAHTHDHVPFRAHGLILAVEHLHVPVGLGPWRASEDPAMTGYAPALLVLVPAERGGPQSTMASGVRSGEQEEPDESPGGYLR